MEKLTLKEKINVYFKSTRCCCRFPSFLHPRMKVLPIPCLFHKTPLCGIHDCGLYYLVAIVVKDNDRRGWINLTRGKREFLGLILERCQIKNGLFYYLLEQLVDTSIYLVEWKKWATVFVEEYEKTFDIILASEQEKANLVLEHQLLLLDIITCVDETEDYEDIESAACAFRIEEMLEAVNNTFKDTWEDRTSSKSVQMSESESFE